MKKNLGVLVILTSLSVWASSASAMGVEEVSNPRSAGLWVSDHAEMIDSETEARLNELLEKAYKDLTVEITVVTVETVDLPTPKDFATALFEHWGIGHESVDNGLLIVMVKDVRRLEMETGYGLEAVLPDGWLKRMQEAEMVPHFRQGDFGEGLFRGAELTVEKVSTERHTVTRLLKTSGPVSPSCTVCLSPLSAFSCSSFSTSFSAPDASFRSPTRSNLPPGQRKKRAACQIWILQIVLDMFGQNLPVA